MLQIREERRQMMFENSVLRRLLGSMRDEVTGEWRKLYNEQLNDLYCLPNIVWLIKSRRIKWTGNVVIMGVRRGVYGVLVWKPEGKGWMEIPRLHRSVIYKRMYRKWNGVECMLLQVHVIDYKSGYHYIYFQLIPLIVTLIK
jgi:hypothetical protein